MKYDIRRHLKDDAHSWAVFLSRDVRGTYIDTIIRSIKPIASGLTYEQALDKAFRMNINCFEESREMEVVC